MKDDKELTNQEKLDEMYHLTLENHDILRSIRRSERVATAFRFIYWLVVLGALGGAYIYISPLIDSLSKNKDKIESSFNQMNQINSVLPDKATLEKLLNLIKKEGATSTSTGN